MTNSISRRDLMARVGAAGAIAGSVVASNAFSAKTRANDEWLDTADLDFDHPISPDPAHIFPRGRGWKVLPNGVDDHDNLEWALRNTASGGVVKLVRGLYKVGRPIVVADFDGTIAGAGAARTTMTCTDELNFELWEAPGGGKEMGELKPPPFPRVPVNGSTTRTPPVLVFFYKIPLQPGEDPSDRANSIVIRNLRCRGAMEGEEWLGGNEVLCFNVVNSLDFDHPESAPETTRQDVTVSGVEVDGYSTPEFGPFENACACITVLGGLVLTSNYDLDGDVDGDAFGAANGGVLSVTPAEGDVTMTSCTFRNCRFGPGVIGYRDGTVRLHNNAADGCRGNCLQVLDVSGARVIARDNDLNCDPFLLPPELVGGAIDVPSSIGCVVALQGVGAALGYPANPRWAALAFDEAAHAAHPEAGPLGTWRPQGPAAAPRPSEFRIEDNACQSSAVPNTYCVHLVDVANLAFGTPTLSAVVRDNACAGSETCVSLEHMERGRVIDNECSSQAFGIELHNSEHARIVDNDFDFPQGADGCEIRMLSLGDKIDLSRVVPGAGVCVEQG